MRALAPLLLIGYLFLAIVSLSHMSHMAMAGTTMSDCPYLVLQSLPGGDLGAHIDTWQHYMLVILPVFFGLFLWFRPLMRLALRDPLLGPGFSSPPGALETICSPLVSLFADGILHPKAP
jgi:hypothetical protein